LAAQHELIGSDLLAARCPIIRETSLTIADPQVRYCGTLGGNVANGDPGNDMPAVMMALGAAYRVEGPSGQRDIPAREFYQGIYSTALQDGEILTEVRIPSLVAPTLPSPASGGGLERGPGDRHGYAYEKQKRKVGDYATAAAAVVLTMSGGSCTSAAIALTNVADTPLFAKDAGEALVGTAIDGAAISEAVRRGQRITSPSADGRGPADFRTHVAGVMVRRAVLRAKERAS
jgi:carbon-monoxide dehydrogenase medium subunit